ncbi:hypothetical protein Tco_0223581 [Tanacetum coccineum]
MNVSNTLSIGRIKYGTETMDEVFSEFDFEAKYHLGKANIVVDAWNRKKKEIRIPIKRDVANRWLCMRKDIDSCGSKYLAYLEVEVGYQGSSGLLLQPELPE